MVDSANVGSLRWDYGAANMTHFIRQCTPRNEELASLLFSVPAKQVETVEWKGE